MREREKKPVKNSSGRIIILLAKEEINRPMA
jgi:hypothetical protein